MGDPPVPASVPRSLGGMCGRYTARTTDADSLASRFAFDERGAGMARRGFGREEVRPTDPVAAVIARHDGSREARLLRWGLAPSWHALRGVRPLINARDDKLRSSGAWKALAADAQTRCLILADGWLEWLKSEDRKQPRQPFLHELPAGEPFAFAGLWTVATPKDGDGPVASCTIVTTTPNRDAARVHDRMPAVLAGREAEAAWLHPDVDLDAALELVGPLPDGVLRISPLAPPHDAASEPGAQLAMPL